MAFHKITCYFSNEGSRNDVRMRVVNKLSNEESGSGNGDGVSRYIYYVETLKSGDRVFLKRPANLHNGFDFLVCVENANYANEGSRMRNYPKHTDIAEDLKLKKQEDPQLYKALYKLMKKIYECNNVTDEEMERIVFSVGLPTDHILKVLKWLFIEQDIRYWNYSGRNMTWKLISET